MTIDVPVADEAYDYAAIAASCDYMIIMAYDEHYSDGEPGSIASSQWLTKYSRA